MDYYEQVMDYQTWSWSTDQAFGARVDPSDRPIHVVVVVNASAMESLVRSSNRFSLVFRGFGHRVSKKHWTSSEGPAKRG